MYIQIDNYLIVEDYHNARLQQEGWWCFEYETKYC